MSRIAHPAWRSRRQAWLTLTACLAAVSAASTAVRASVNQEVIPGWLANLLGDFVEPGAAVWWLSLGGAFQAFPDGGEGYAVVVAANTAFWLLVAAIVAPLARLAYRFTHRPKP